MKKEIKHVASAEINRLRWDDTVQKAPNGYVYCRSVFLDALCTWDALIMGDYEYIMPLPFNSKWGFHYIYTPYFIGQLGIISANPISAGIVESFISHIPLKFKFIELHLNEANPLPMMQGVECNTRNNYVLPLNELYHLIEDKYSRDAKKNLRQAYSNPVQIEENVAPSLVIDLFKTAYGDLNKGINQNIYDRFNEACVAAIQQRVGFTVAVKNSYGEILAAAFFGIDDKRIYYMAGAPSALGRKLNAQHVVINEVIKKNAGTKLSLDFEGSDIPTVANFYKKFSPALKSYQHIKINRLPLWAKWFKR